MKLHSKILLGLALGAGAGIAVNALAPQAVWARWMGDYVAGPVGQVFLRMLLMTTVPLVFASIALGVAGLGDLRNLGRVGAKTVAYFLLSTALSAALGLLLVNLFRPGEGLDAGVRRQLFEAYRSQAEGMQAGGETRFGIRMLIDVVPRNPVQAAAEMNMLAVIFFATVFGAALTAIPKDKAEVVLRFLDGLLEVILKVVDFAMKLAPYGVFGLIFVVTSRFGWEILRQLGAYVAVVLGGLFLYAAVGLSLLVWTLGRMSPVSFWKKARATIVTSFSTSSSNATLPTNISVAVREMGLPPRIAGFVLPLGATMNMNGTSLYEGVTVLFLAQVFGVHLDLGQQAVVLVLSVITAVGTAGVPGGSLPMIMTVLAAVGVPPEGIAIVLGVDRILDMCRTVLNTTGDLTAAIYVARSEGDRTRRMAAVGETGGGGAGAAAG